MGPSVWLLFMCGAAVPSTGDRSVLLLDDGIRLANLYTWTQRLLPSHSISLTIQAVCECEDKRMNILTVCVHMCDGLGGTNGGDRGGRSVLKWETGQMFINSGCVCQCCSLRAILTSLCSSGHEGLQR